MSDRSLANVIALADIGNRQALGDLCRRYRTGEGAPRSDAEALARCTQGAEAGIRASQVWLGDMYMEGRGVAVDHAKALRWYREAADHGQAQAMFSLYRFYAEGLGVPVDHEAARRYLRQAADGGDLQAIDVLRASDKQWRPPPADGDTDEPVAKGKEPDFMRIVGDPGMFVSSFYRLAAAPHRRVRMRIAQFKSHPQWAPMASLCFSAEGPSEFVCVKLAKYAQDADTLGVALVTLPPDEKSESDWAQVADDHVLSQSVIVDFDYQAPFWRMTVNGQPTSIHRIDFVPELMRLACSTALCEFQAE